MVPRNPGWHAARASLLALLLVLTGCASIGPQTPRVPSQAFPGGEHTALGRALAGDRGYTTPASAFRLVASGRSALALRLSLADLAERSIDLQVYTVDEDASADLVLQRLDVAAQRGVRVRILLDDISPSTREFARRAAALHPGIHVRLFNPFRFADGSGLARVLEAVVDGARLNRRMHNKLFIADNAGAIFGSRNIGAAYFEAEERANFVDAELLAAGAIVGDLSRAFDAYWNSATAVPIEALVPVADWPRAEAVRAALQRRLAACLGGPLCGVAGDPEWTHALRDGRVALTPAEASLDFDDPDQLKSPVATGVEHGSIDDHAGGRRTEAELLFVSPYFVPTALTREHLGAMRARGVRVAVLTNSLAATDSVAAHSGYARHRTALLQRGIELYELRPLPGRPHVRSHRWSQASPSSLHAKIVVQDRRRAIVGSMNQDPRSHLYNTELWVTLDSPELAAELAALFDEGSANEHAYQVQLHDADDPSRVAWATEDDGRGVRHDVEPMTSIWLRLWRWKLGLVIPEHLL